MKTSISGPPRSGLTFPMPDTAEEMIDLAQKAVDELRHQYELGADLTYLEHANSAFLPIYKWYYNNHAHNTRKSTFVTNPSSSKDKQVARDVIGRRYY
jgi:hypothetical protein